MMVDGKSIKFFYVPHTTRGQIEIQYEQLM